MNNFDEDKKIYLTSSVFYYNNKMYFEEDDSEDNSANTGNTLKYTKITLRNWLKYLDEYGWEEINDGWKKRLGYKNSCNYGLIDCGGGGNCLFHCIAQSLNKPYEPDAELYDYQDIRNIAAEQINQDNLDIILINYRALKEVGDFDGYWDPNDIESVEELQEVIRESGDSFWGDHIIIQLLQEALDMNIIILNCDKDYYLSDYSDASLKERFNVHPLAHNINKHPKSILLSYIDELHFLLVGYFDKGKIQTLFKTKKLPKNFMKIYNEDCHI